MVNDKSWEEETISRLRRAREQRKQAEADAAYWVEMTDALEKVVELGRQERGNRFNGHRVIDLDSLRTKSIREALIEIAAVNDGLLVTADAAQIMVDANMYTTKEQARNTIFSVLYHVKKLFRKEGPGYYRLIGKPSVELKLGV